MRNTDPKQPIINMGIFFLQGLIPVSDWTKFPLASVGIFLEKHSWYFAMREDMANV